MRAWGKGQPPWKNHGFTRQIAYAYKAVLFRALTHRRVYLTDIYLYALGVYYAAIFIRSQPDRAMENKLPRDFSTEDADIAPFNLLVVATPLSFSATRHSLNVSSNVPRMVHTALLFLLL